MAAPKGNEFWKQRSTHGRKPLWEDSELLKEACYEYIQWAHDNPLEEALTYQGEVMENSFPKMRAMSIAGICVYLGMTVETWAQYRKIKDYSLVIREIEQIMYSQKFEGASAGMLNPNIIARDLGLTDKKEVSGDPGKPLVVISSEMSAVEATGLYKSLIDD